jgi:RNA polymerase sigma-70 factor (ECF subfamily)
MQSGDEDRWQEFYLLYAPVLRSFALKAGLTETEADEVVQETCIGVAKNIGEFHYDPKLCRFKSWLLNLASWRVKNQFIRRQRWDERVHKPAGEPLQGAAGLDARSQSDNQRTATIERLADPSGQTFDTIWDKEWRTNLLNAALEKVRSQFSATQFQIFDLNAFKEWPAGEVARSLGVSLANVYLTKHRVSAALKKELARLERQMDRGL